MKKYSISSPGIVNLRTIYTMKTQHTINKHSNNQQTIDETYIVATKSDMSFRVSYYGMCWSSFV